VVVSHAVGSAVSSLSLEPPQAATIKDNAAKPATASFFPDFLIVWYSPESLSPLLV
jgi:hypothetical protein